MDKPLGLELRYLAQGTSLKGKASLLGLLERTLMRGYLYASSAHCKAIYHTAQRRAILKLRENPK